MYARTKATANRDVYNTRPIEMTDIRQWNEGHGLWKYLIPNTCMWELNTRPIEIADIWLW